MLITGANDSVVTEQAYWNILFVVCCFQGLTDAFLEATKFMFAACDNSISVAVDGVAAKGLPQYTIWPTVYSVDVPAMAQLIALSVSARSTGMMMTMTNPSAMIGFVANTSVVSDASWKCTTSTPPTGWMLPTFDDTWWSQGPVGDQFLQQTLAMTCDLNSCTQCNPKAKWLGYSNNFNIIGSPLKFYCRLHLPREEGNLFKNFKKIKFLIQI